MRDYYLVPQVTDLAEHLNCGLCWHIITFFVGQNELKDMIEGFGRELEDVSAGISDSRKREEEEVKGVDKVDFLTSDFPELEQPGLRWSELVEWIHLAKLTYWDRLGPVLPSLPGRHVACFAAQATRRAPRVCRPFFVGSIVSVSIRRVSKDQVVRKYSPCNRARAGLELLDGG